MNPDLERSEEELGDALTRQALLNDRCTELTEALELARARGQAAEACELAAQLDVVEARRTRAMALAQGASQRLSQLRHHLIKD